MACYGANKSDSDGGLAATVMICAWVGSGVHGARGLEERVTRDVVGKQRLLGRCITGYLYVHHRLPAHALLVLNQQLGKAVCHDS